MPSRAAESPYRAPQLAAPGPPAGLTVTVTLLQAAKDDASLVGPGPGLGSRTDERPWDIWNLGSLLYST